MTKACILITAATGLTGHAAVTNLIKKGHPVRALAHREDDRSRALQGMGAEVVFGDFDDFSAMKAALKDTKRAYFCYQISKGLVQATAQFGQGAKESGVEVIVTMSRKIAREDAASHASFEHWLLERVLDWTGFAVTHLRPTFFTEWMLMLSSMIRQGQVYVPFANGKTAFITAEDQGRATVTILENPKNHQGKTYYLCGPEELSFQEAVEKADRVTGKHVSYNLVPFAVMRENIAANSAKSGRNNALSGYGESNQPDGSGEPHIFQHLQAAHQDFENGLFRGLNNEVEQVSSPGECHPEALSEPYLNLSAHTAPAMEPRRTPICQCANNVESRRDMRAIQCVARRRWPRSFLYFPYAHWASERSS